MEAARERLSQREAWPCSSTLTKNNIRAGIHVVHESNAASTEILPTKYSVREIGRLRYSCTEWLAKSLVIIPGPPHAARMNPIPASKPRKPRKKSLLTVAGMATLPVRSRAWAAEL